MRLFGFNIHIRVFDGVRWKKLSLFTRIDLIARSSRDRGLLFKHANTFIAYSKFAYCHYYLII